VKILLVVLTSFFVSKSISAQDLNDLFHEISGDADLHFSGTVLVADHGKVIYKNSAGYADISNKVMNSDVNRFPLASLSKVFTAIAIMQLVEKGKLNLDDHLVQYLPDFPYSVITVRQLLSHTSGLPDFREVFAKSQGHPLTNSDVIPALKEYDKLIAEPGTRWSYSSVGYALLAQLVEKISNLSFSKYLSDNIFRPAGMLHTYLLTPDIKYSDSLRAISYVSRGNPLQASDSLKTDLTIPWQTISGPGLVVSSTEDLLLFSEALFEDKLLNAATQNQMYTSVKLLNGQFAELAHAPLYSGLGWAIDMNHESGTIVSYNGGSPGIATILLRNLDTRITVIVLENTDNTGALDFGVNAMNILNHKPVRRFRPMPNQ
jgi:CubicO group peptidase (beta-lactamase class C family)